MAELDRQYTRNGVNARTDVIDEGLRSYMLRVYNYMAIGLGITGLTSIGGYLMSVTTDPAGAVARLPNGAYLTQFGLYLFDSPLKWVVMLAPLGPGLSVERAH